MSKIFDRLIGSFTIEKHEKFVRTVAIFSLISMILCVALFLTGALYKLELKIRTDGVVKVLDKGGILGIELKVDNRFFENVVEGQTVLVKDKKTGKELGNFRIAEIYAPEFEKSVFFTILIAPVKPLVIPDGIKVGDAVLAEIVYKKVRIIQILFKKKI